MRRLLVAAFSVLVAGVLVACPDLSDLSSNFDASTDAAGQDAIADVVVSDCAALRRVQVAHFNENDSDASATTLSLQLPLAQSAGDFIVATVNYDDANCGSVASVTDTSGNAYVRLIPADTLYGAGALETWGAQNVRAADLAQNTVTATFANDCVYRSMKIVHYTGIATTSAVESTSSEHGGDGATPTHTIDVTTPALLFAHTADEHVAYEAGVGWSLILQDDWATIAEERDALDAGTYPVTYVPSNENWLIQAIALRRCQ